jgi:hypothetical protein
MRVKINGWVSFILLLSLLDLILMRFTDVIAAEEERMKERKANHDAEVKTIHDAEARAAKPTKPKASA